MFPLLLILKKKKMSKINTHNTWVGILKPKISTPTNMKCYYCHNISQYFGGNTYTKNIKNLQQHIIKVNA